MYVSPLGTRAVGAAILAYAKIEIGNYIYTLRECIDEANKEGIPQSYALSPVNMTLTDTDSASIIYQCYKPKESAYTAMFGELIKEIQLLGMGHLLDLLQPSYGDIKRIPLSFL